MTRLEFQKWLEQFPEHTIIEVGIQEPPEGYDNWGYVSFKEFDGDLGFSYYDFDDDKFEGKKFLQLGQKY